MKLPTAQTQKRHEDFRLITGAGRYTADNHPAGLLHIAFVRSPYAHARIRKIDTDAAKQSEGVVAVITGADLAAAGAKPIPGGFRLNRHDGRPAPKTNRPSLISDIVRYLGEAVAAVVAETHAQALAGVELVEVDYDGLPAAIGMAAVEPGAPAVWDEAPDNIAFFWQGGDAAATEAALQSAAHVVRQTLTVSRVTCSPMETRNVLAKPGEGGRIVVHASHQSPHNLLDGLVSVGFKREDISVQIGDVGGSFGLKTGVFPEITVAVHAAQRLQRPVLWESTRGESFLTDEHGREMDADVEIGFDAEHRITGLRVNVRGSVGAYVSGKSGWSIGNIGGIAGVYDIPAIYAKAYGFFSHTVPTAAYRGAGRPEATYQIERILDIAANELGISPLELRRRNLIAPSAMPYRTALVFNYDCGEFEANMDMAAKMADVAGFAARKDEAARRGKLRGLGIANCIEAAGGPFTGPMPDAARVALLSNGRVRVQSGSMSVGQSHETVMPQIVAEQFGIPASQVDYVMGDTDGLPLGRGNGGSSAMCTGVPAILTATGKVIARLNEIAAELLDAPPDTVTLSDGIFRSREANRTLTLAEVASAAEPIAEGVAAEDLSTYKPPAVTFPNGTHICEVEIDPETGVVEVTGYAAVEDIGRVIHPMLAEGQIQGGVAQGIGQALGEMIVYDEDGQMLSGSFMDYTMPRADSLPSYNLAFREVLTKVNALGVKGVGEAGTVGAMSAAMNAINDALVQVGIRHLDMPATPSRVWQAINAAR
jgi:aerobic carbon-monoxide dehydrogenase large subunit